MKTQEWYHTGCTIPAKVDLHAHVQGRNFNHFLSEAEEASQSASRVRGVFTQARSKGMTFVTLTEHNSIESSLLLKHLYPDDTFTGVEVTATFPEDGGKVHVLLFDLREAEFEEVQGVRKDIYGLRDFLKERRIAYSVAHAIHSLERKDLKVEHLEKLLLLFDVFEIVNGGCSYGSNHIWTNLFRNLTPDYIDGLVAKHHIRPTSEDPWIKGFTGGSDDHGEGDIGNIYTLSPARSVEEFMDYLRRRLTFVGETRGAVCRQPTQLKTGQTEIQNPAPTGAVTCVEPGYGFQGKDNFTEAA